MSCGWGGGTYNATLTPVVTNGVITSVTITAAGSGMTAGTYTSAGGKFTITDPTGVGAQITVTIASGAVSAVAVNSGEWNWTSSASGGTGGASIQRDPGPRGT